MGIVVERHDVKIANWIGTMSPELKKTIGLQYYALSKHFHILSLPAQFRGETKWWEQSLGPLLLTWFNFNPSIDK